MLPATVSEISSGRMPANDTLKMPKFLWKVPLLWVSGAFVATVIASVFFPRGFLFFYSCAHCMIFVLSLSWLYAILMFVYLRHKGAGGKVGNVIKSRLHCERRNRCRRHRCHRRHWCFLWTVLLEALLLAQKGLAPAATPLMAHHRCVVSCQMPSSSLRTKKTRL